MNHIEFSNSFDTLLASYTNIAESGLQASRMEVSLDEWEKSVFLTKAQEDIVVELYNGKNPFGDSFEITEELRRYLDNLIKTSYYLRSDAVTADVLTDESICFKLPDDIAFITYEQVRFEDESLGCYDGNLANVYPITQDEFAKVRRNPFRGATKYKALRLDAGNNIVELISKYTIGNYTVRYLSKPKPIILVDLPEENAIEGITAITECELNPVLHRRILERAVLAALGSRGIYAQAREAKANNR